MEQKMAIAALGALGNETRLDVFRLLVRAGDSGLPVGRIGSEIGVPLSTLSHHLDRLVRADLVRQEKNGRTVHCMANFETLSALTAYLTEACCSGLPDVAPHITKNNETSILEEEVAQ